MLVGPTLFMITILIDKKLNQKSNTKNVWKNTTPEFHLLLRGRFLSAQNDIYSLHIENSSVHQIRQNAHQYAFECFALIHAFCDLRHLWLFCEVYVGKLAVVHVVHCQKTGSHTELWKMELIFMVGVDQKSHRSPMIVFLPIIPFLINSKWMSSNDGAFPWNPKPFNVFINWSW